MNTAASQAETYGAFDFHFWMVGAADYPFSTHSCCMFFIALEANP